MKHFGWQPLMLGYGAVVLAILPLLTLLRPPPEPLVAGTRPAWPAARRTSARAASQRRDGADLHRQLLLLHPDGYSGVASCRVLRRCRHHAQPWRRDAVGDAGLCLCFSSVLGRLRRPLRRPAHGDDRIDACQMLAIGAFLLTRNEIGLFVIASAFGLGFSGIIPAYSVTIRDLYPSKEASWRIPTVLMTAMSGMAFGSWFAGKLFDLSLSYRPAFAAGVLFNLANLVVVLFLVSRTPPTGSPG